MIASMRRTHFMTASRGAAVTTLLLLNFTLPACIEVDPFQTADTGATDTTLADTTTVDTTVNDSMVDDSALPEDTGPAPDTTPVGPLVADRCDQAGPGISSVPATVIGSTLEANDDYDVASCFAETPVLGALRSDAVVRLELTQPGRYAARLKPYLDGNRGPTLLYIATGCSNGNLACDQVSHDMSDGSTWWFTLGEEAIGDAWLVLDGLFPNDVGSFDLTLDGPCTPACEEMVCGSDGCGGTCGDCEEPLSCAVGGSCALGPLPGDTCSEPFDLVTAGSSGVNDTTYGGDSSVGVCGAGDAIGQQRTDHVWRFTAAEEGTYTFTLDADFSASLYIKNNCINSNALGCAVERDDAGAFVVRQPLAQDQTVYAFVDGMSDGPVGSGAYTIAVSEVCVPDCTDRVCGDDGCGGSCGVCTGEQVCRELFGTCEIVPGNACISPLDLDGVPPMSVTGDTSVDAQDTFSYVSGCPTGPTSAGAGAADNVYRFVAPTSAVFTFTLVASYDARLYVATDCDAPDQACLGASAPGVGSDTVSVSLPLSESDIYYVFVDGGGGGSGPYELTVSAPCTPNCTDRTCGSDGCGTSCGTCEVDQVCGAGNCVSLDGEGCGAPFPVDAQTLPTSVSATTAASLDALGGCPEAGSVVSAQSPDQVWSFTPLVSGVYSVHLAAEFQAVLSLRASCEDACLGDDAVGGQASASVTAPLVAGITYFVVVDGQDGESGPYDLTFDAPCAPSCDDKVCGADGCGSTCGDCNGDDACDAIGQCVPASAIPANLCGAPLEVTAVPFDMSMDSLVGSDEHAVAASSCGPMSPAAGAGHVDHFYSFTAPSDGVYTAQVVSNRERSIAVYSDCQLGQGTCYAADAGDDPSVDFAMLANETRMIVVDGFGSDVTGGTYEFSVSPPCTPACPPNAVCGSDGCSGSCGSCPDGLACDQGLCGPPTGIPGESCTTPIPVASIPFSYAGNTTWSSNSHSFAPGQCATIAPGWGAGSPDNVFSFVPQTTGDYRIWLTGDFDQVLYVATDCGDIGGSCVIGDDVLGTGIESVLLSATAGQNYFIVVDGFSNSSAIVGEYQLTIEAL